MLPIKRIFIQQAAYDKQNAENHVEVETDAVWRRHSSQSLKLSHDFYPSTITSSYLNTFHCQ